MSEAFSVHPVLVLALGLAGLPLVAGELRFLRLRREGWLLPVTGALAAAAAWLAERLPGLARPCPEGLSAWPWLSARLLLALAALAVLLRVAPLRPARGDMARAGGGTWGAWLAAAPLPVFWSLLDPFAGRLPAAWVPVATGLAALVLMALMTGAEEKSRLNRLPAGLAGLPHRLLVLAVILLLTCGAEALLAGRLP